MHNPFRSAPALRFSPAALALTSILLAGSAHAALAQVSTNQGALDQLSSGASPAHSTAPAHHGHPHHPAAHAVARPQATAKPGHSGANPHPPAPTIPAAPPPQPVFKAPVINVPLHPPPPPPPVPVVQTAQGSVSAIADGSRITFGPGSADLNPATMQALHDFASRMKASPLQRADLDAMSASTPDDPSMPRRLALARGLAARAVLINDGIASTRIYPKVMTVTAGADGAPPDRVDMVLSPIPGSDTPPPPPGSSIAVPVPDSAAAPVPGRDTESPGR